MEASNVPVQIATCFASSFHCVTWFLTIDKANATIYSSYHTRAHTHAQHPPRHSKIIYMAQTLCDEAITGAVNVSVFGCTGDGSLMAITPMAGSH